MRDQAETLRQMMRDRNTSMSEAEDGVIPPVIVAFTSARTDEGRSESSGIVLNLALYFARTQLRVLLVEWQGKSRSDRAGEGALVESFLREVEPGFWVCSPKIPWSSILESPAPQRKQLLGRLLDSSPEVDVVLLDLSWAERQEWPLTDAKGVILLAPGDSVHFLQSIQDERRDRPLSVIVNQVTDSGQARALYSKLSSSVEYLGHFPKNEKFTEAVRNGKNLLDWNYGRARSNEPVLASLELLAKQMKKKFLKMEEREIADVARRLRAGRFGPAARFMEEPAPKAPGNTAKLWKTLLGEVEA